jgi:hypothetical protein
MSWLSITRFYWLSVDGAVDWSVHLRRNWLFQIEKFNGIPMNFDGMLKKWRQMCYRGADKTERWRGSKFWLEFPERMWVKSVGPADDLADSGHRLLTLTRS